MKKYVVIPAALIATLLAGCSSTVDVIHKTGSTTAQRQTAADQCKIASFREIPVQMTVESFGGMYDPGQYVCRDYRDRRRCGYVGGIDIPPSVRTYDANQDLRSRYVQRCLASKGYNILTVPRCTSSADKAAFQASQDKQPPSSKLICASGTPITQGLL